MTQYFADLKYLVFRDIRKYYAKLPAWTKDLVSYSKNTVNRCLQLLNGIQFQLFCDDEDTFAKARDCVTDKYRLKSY